MYPHPVCLVQLSSWRQEGLCQKDSNRMDRWQDLASTGQAWDTQTTTHNCTHTTTCTQMLVIAHTQSHTCTCVACRELPRCGGLWPPCSLWLCLDTQWRDGHSYQSCAWLWAGGKGSETDDLPCKVAEGLRVSTTQHAAASPSCRAGPLPCFCCWAYVFPTSQLPRQSLRVPPAPSCQLCPPWAQAWSPLTPPHTACHPVSPAHI